MAKFIHYFSLWLIDYKSCANLSNGIYESLCLSLSRRRRECASLRLGREGKILSEISWPNVFWDNMRAVCWPTNGRYCKIEEKRNIRVSGYIVRTMRALNNRRMEQSLNRDREQITFRVVECNLHFQIVCSSRIVISWIGICIYF